MDQLEEETMIHQIIGAAWFVGVVIWLETMGVPFGFWHVIALGHMAIATITFFGAFKQ